MPDYLDYQKSIAAEFKAFEKRVRNLIDDRNWGEEGRYKEAVLKNYLRHVLPKNLSIGTGFVRNGMKSLHKLILLYLIIHTRCYFQKETLL